MVDNREWHGDASNRTHTKEYKAWSAMKDRCNNPNCDAYGYYGGRGIKVCERWENSYIAFLKDMGRAKPNETLDRIDNNGNYEPGNVRWAVRKVQQGNRRNTTYVFYNGRKMTLNEACEISGIKPNTVRARKFNGWPESEWFIESSDGRGMHGNQYNKNEKYIIYNNKKMTIRDAIKISGLNENTVRYRIRQGWPEDKWFINVDSHANRDIDFSI